MKIFLAIAYSSQVNYETGEVFPEYKQEVENTIDTITAIGHEVFCALKADQYRINDSDPAAAFKLDEKKIKESDALLAVLASKTSEGVQTEIGMAIALGKTVILAHEADQKLGWFNQAIVKAGQGTEIELPITAAKLAINLRIWYSIFDVKGTELLLLVCRAATGGLFCAL